MDRDRSYSPYGGWSVRERRSCSPCLGMQGQAGGAHALGQDTRSRYGDLLRGRRDPELERLVADLATVSGATEPPPTLAASLEQAIRERAMERRRAMLRALPAGTSRPSERRFLRLALRWSVVVALFALLIVVAPGSTTALDNITNLGPSSNAVSPYVPLGSFHHINLNLHQRGKPELLVIGTQVDNSSAIERWPVVKALDQFGTLSNARGVQSPASEVIYPQAYTRCRVVGDMNAFAGYPTFDWEHTHYTSRYLVFVHKDLIDANRHLGQRLSSQELALFNRYARLPGCAQYQDAVWQTALSDEPGPRLPLVLVGGYLEVGAQVAVPGDLAPSTGATPLTFGAVRQALQRGRSDRTMSPSLVKDINEEVNIITALICHADGRRPASVCGRATIKTILKHVK